MTDEGPVAGADRAAERARLADFLPRRADPRRRDLRRGVVLLAIAAAMGLQQWQGSSDVFFHWTPQDIARAAILPAFAGLGFLLAYALVRYRSPEE